MCRTNFIPVNTKIRKKIYTGIAVALREKLLYYKTPILKLLINPSINKIINQIISPSKMLQNRFKLKLT